MTREQIKAELRLFKSYTDDSVVKVENTLDPSSLSKGLLYDCDYVTDDVQELSEELYGIYPEKWNATFHKSFSTVRDASIHELVLHQILHYITTYGFEALGIYDKDTVYLPKEALDIPDIENDIPLVIIHKITELELRQKLMVLLTSGIALSEETVSDIMLLSDYLDKNEFSKIKNREVKIALYDKYGVVPNNNVEFLRFLIYKTSGETLLIKNNYLKRKLKQLDEGKTHLAYNYIQKYLNTDPNNWTRLSEIYWRYKDLFMAYKRPGTNNKHLAELNHIINKLDKLARKYHKPLDTQILDKLTSFTDIEGVMNQKQAIEKAIKEATTFRLIRIYNSINYRLKNVTSADIPFMYRIRNGKSYVRTNSKLLYYDINIAAFSKINDMILAEILRRLSDKLTNKSIYIPSNIVYIAPASEKQFLGNIPEGSYIEIPRTENMLVGIHWKNLPEERVDLDLHMQDRSGHYGWNGAWRDSNRDFMFSGDVTDAKLPNGATEVFYIGRNSQPRSFLLTLNKFTANKKEVPYEIVVATTKDSEVNENYIINPNNIISQINRVFPADSNMITIGLVQVLPDCIRFCFSSSDIGKSIVTHQDNIIDTAREYLNKYSQVQLSLNTLLEMLLQVNNTVTLANSAIVETMQEVKVPAANGTEETLYRKVVVPVDYNLSLDAIDKASFIDLLGGI